VVLPSWPPSLVAVLPFMGVMWRGCVAPCISLYIIADRRGNSAYS
jgi:hypothetical protein